MFSGRPSVPLSVRASVRDSCGSFMFPRYLQYLLTDFRHTFVTGASWDTDDLITFFFLTLWWTNVFVIVSRNSSDVQGHSTPVGLHPSCSVSDSAAWQHVLCGTVWLHRSDTSDDQRPAEVLAGVCIVPRTVLQLLTDCCCGDLYFAKMLRKIWVYLDFSSFIPGYFAWDWWRLITAGRRPLIMPNQQSKTKKAILMLMLRSKKKPKSYVSPLNSSKV